MQRGKPLSGKSLRKIAARGAPKVDVQRAEAAVCFRGRGLPASRPEYAIAAVRGPLSLWNLHRSHTRSQLEANVVAANEPLTPVAPPPPLSPRCIQRATSDEAIAYILSATGRLSENESCLERCDSHVSCYLCKRDEERRTRPSGCFHAKPEKDLRDFRKLKIVREMRNEVRTVINGCSLRR